MNDGASLTLQNLALVKGNSAQLGGGALTNFGTVTLINSTIKENVALIEGGAILNFGEMTILRSTLSGNSAPGGVGGAVFNTGRLTVTNSTLSGNSAGEAGGAIWALDATIVHSTLVNNSAGVGGAAFIGVLTVKNSIVAGPSPQCLLTFGQPLGRNFVTDTSCSGDVPNPSVDVVSLKALNLGPLADNGGPTQTHALLPGSVAIGAVGDCTDLVGGGPEGGPARTAAPPGAAL